MKNKVIHISDWNVQFWVNTGGTRSKKYVQAPDGNYYYFKRSYKTEGRDYFFEFWSEIIATQIGESLGFQMLKYVPAIDGNEMGCLSESMINSDTEELIEGGKYLTAVENRFDPANREGRRWYSYQLIGIVLEAFKLDHHMDKIIEHIIFDAIIGNGDRHQENWAFVSEISFIPNLFNELESAAKSGKLDKAPKFIQVLFLDRIWDSIIDFKSKALKPEANLVRLYTQKVNGVAPIFDSGSSLGRELTEEKIEAMLRDRVQLEAYIKRGPSEIHWENRKVSHFELIDNLLGTSYHEIVLSIIKRVKDSYNPDNIERMINDIDDGVPAEYEQFRLTPNRKLLIFKLVTLRIEKLIALGDERV